MPLTTRREAAAMMLATASLSAPAAAQPAFAPIDLPAVRPDFGGSLAQALRARRSTREFATTRKLPLSVLAELLWCAYGVNRPTTTDRTAPSWRHARETDIFAVMADGVWRYDALTHRLLPHLTRDIRAATGVQDFVGTAPLNLVYVSDANHLGDISYTERHRVASADTGFIGQNVYLYCAAQGLATVFRGSLDTAALGRTLGLAPSQFVTFAQTVGYPRT